MRPTRMRAPNEIVIVQSASGSLPVNPVSSCLAADAGTGNSWWQGYLEQNAGSAATERIAGFPLILTIEDLDDPPVVEISMFGIIDNQTADGAFDIDFGVYLTRPSFDGETAHAVQNVVGPNNGNPRYIHRHVGFVPTAGTVGAFHFWCQMSWGLHRPIVHDAGTSMWKQQFASRVTTVTTTQVNNAAPPGLLSVGPVTTHNLGYSNFNCGNVNGVRITPYMGKNAVRTSRLLVTDGYVRPIPENNRPSLGLSGGLFGL